MFERLAPEQHDTLDGIPEPAENPTLCGHAEAKSMIAGALRAGKFPHALILAGQQGIGKATLAFHLANLLLKNPDPASVQDIGSPDPSSSIFRQVASGAHPSVLHLTRPVNERTKGFKTVVTVDEIRKVNRFLSMTAHDGGWRVVIVDPADDMNTNAANALLKNLEEPPAKTVFVLIVHSIGAMLPTIRSRSQTVRLGPLSNSDLKQVLASFEDTAVADGPELDALIHRAGGSVRTAILLFYVTTAIAYPNGEPHIGHAYEMIATDAIARFQRLDGKDVFFLTGTDEHGIKMQQTARAEGITPRELADRNSQRIPRHGDMLNISNDDFIRTTEERHYKSSQEIWSAMAASKRRHLPVDLCRLVFGARRGLFRRGDELTEGEDGKRFAPARRARSSGWRSRAISSACRPIRTGC
jgi:DNA polymerase III delta' subunit